MFYKKNRCQLWHCQETHNNNNNDELKTRKMFKAKETLRLSWDGRYPIHFKSDKGKGKTT
jgi:hypothetical protein